MKTLKIGGLNPDKTGYYFALDDLNDIAVVSTSKADIFLRNIEQYASLSDFIPYSLKSYLDDETFLGTSVQNCSIKHRDSNETVQISRNSEQKLCAVSPDGFSLDQDAQNQIENAPFSFTAKQLYCYKINQSILYSSGLSDPICTVAFKIHDSTHTIKIGAKASQTQYYHNEEEHTHEHDDTISSDYYVMLDDIPAIYTANESYLPWLNIKN